MSVTLLRSLGLLAVLVAVVAAFAFPAFAEGDEATRAAEGKGEPSADELTLEDLTKLLTENRAAFWIGMLSRWGSLVIGAILLIRFWLYWDKVKGGMIAPPPRVEPPALAPAGHALLYAAAAVAVMPAMFGLMGVSLFGKENSTPVAFAATALATLPLAAWVVLRKNRLETVNSRIQAAVEIPRRGPVRSFGLGLWTFCVASVAVVPAYMASAAVIALFEEVEPQELIQKVVQSEDNALPTMVLIFGVFIAPFTEECIFRGLLYPSFKQGLGGNRRAAIISAIVVSLIFAAIHQNLLAFLPLFFLALVLTWVYERTSSLAAVVFAHAVHNFLSLLPLMILRG